MKSQNIFALNTLNKKFLIPTLILTVILLGGLGAIMVEKNHATMRSIMESKGNAMADLLAQISVNYIMNYDLSALEGFVKETLKDSEVVYVVFYDADKKPLTEISKETKDNTSLFVYEREIRDRQENDKLLGFLKLGYSQQTLARNLRSGIQTVVVSNLIALALLVFGVTYLFRGITRPFGHLVEVIEQMARGDLTVQVEADLVTRRDEMGILANAFSRMSASLKGVIKKIQDASSQVIRVAEQGVAGTKRVSDGAIRQAQAAEQTSSSIVEMNTSINKITENIGSLSASSQDTSASLTEMSSAISQVAGNTVALSTSVEDTVSSLSQMSSAIKQVVDHIHTLSSSAEAATSSMTEMNASIKEVDKNAKESAVLAEKVSQDAAELGSVAIEQTIDGIKQIQKAVEKSSNVINKLDERTEQIGKILIVIDEVAKQTNLLALNASILAAQAGEQGKGFAVVADAIKGLADRTTASTKEIDQLIQNVQSEIKDAVLTVNEGMQSAEEGVRRSTHAQGSLNKILDSSKHSLKMSRQIEKETLEQVRASHQVTQLMTQMNAMVQQIESIMKELENLTLRITQSAEKMEAITQQVNISTEEQARGSKQISAAGENVALKVQQIAQAMNEQKKESEVIRTAILEIQRITQLSVQMSQQMNQAMDGLIQQAGLLKGEVNHFKI